MGQEFNHQNAAQIDQHGEFDSNSYKLDAAAIANYLHLVFETKWLKQGVRAMTIKNWKLFRV